MIVVKYKGEDAVRYSIRNFKFSVKRIRPLLYNIRAKQLHDAISYINVDGRKASKVIANLILSIKHVSDKSTEKSKLFTAYATTGLRKQGIIRRSRSHFARQKSRTSNLFFVVSR